MKKSLILTVLLILVSLLPDVSADQQTVPAAVTPRLRLGMVVPLSGPLAFFGTDLMRAAKIFSADNPALGRHVEIIWEDSAYESRQAIAAFHKLVTAERTDVVFAFGGPMLSALAPLAEAKKIPFFASEAEKHDCEGRQYCSLFRNEEDQWGEATWRALRKQGKRHLGIVKNQNQFMDTFVDAIIRTKRADEVVEILLDVPPDVIDLRSAILPLRTKQFDALGVFLLPNSHRAFLNALRAINKPLQLIGVAEFLVEEHNKGYEELIEGTLVVAPYATPRFAESFQRDHGNSAGLYDASALYDFLTLLHEVAAAQPALRGLDLVNALHFQGIRHGVSGRYSQKRSPNGVYSINFPIAIYRVSRDGTAVDDVFEF